MTCSPDELRAVMRGWASGVTLVTTLAGKRPWGMTVSAFHSVSAEPPLVMACVHSGARTHGYIEASRVFAVHLLAEGQFELATRFASPEPEDRRFQGLSWRSGQSGAPLIEGVLGRFDCRLRSQHREGSHSIFIGDVLSADSSSGRPLLYWDGDFRALRDR